MITTIPLHVTSDGKEFREHGDAVKHEMQTALDTLAKNLPRDAASLARWLNDNWERLDMVRPMLQTQASQSHPSLSITR